MVARLQGKQEQEQAGVGLWRRSYLSSPGGGVEKLCFLAEKMLEAKGLLSGRSSYTWHPT